jgi:SCY1-like protein 1
MFKSLGSLWGPTFPYTLDASPFCDRSWGQWIHYRGVSKEDNSAVSVFKIEAPDANDRKLVAARNGVKRSKTVSVEKDDRH